MGIECAYYEVTIERALKGRKKLKTCFLFDSNIANTLSNSTEIDYVTNATFNLILTDLSIDNDYFSFIIHIIPSNLYKLSYDSLTRKMTMTVKNSFSKLIISSKILCLLILCLL